MGMKMLKLYHIDYIIIYLLYNLKEPLYFDPVCSYLSIYVILMMRSPWRMRSHFSTGEIWT